VQKLREQMRMMKFARSTVTWVKILLLIVLIAVSLFLYHNGFFHLFLNKEKVIAFIESLGPLSFLGFIALQAAQVIFAPLPGEITGILGGYLYGLCLGVTLSTLGLVFGSYLAFVISRAYGRPFVECCVSKSVMDRFNYVIHHKGIFLIFLLFLLPGFPKDYLCFLLGLGDMSTREFLVVSSVGRVFGTILLTLGGGFIRYHEYEKLYILVGCAVLVVVCVLMNKDKIEKVLRTLRVRNC
jgi:uncharacterized membrane protein YdjX (TVP38/TMEM64 family)